MEKKFHLVNGEPKPCTASVRDCPVGGEHFNTKAEARASYGHENRNRLFQSLNKNSKPNDKQHDSSKYSNSDAGISAQGIAIATSASMFGALILGGIATYQGNVNASRDAAKAANTPYSITLTMRDRATYSAKLVDANLKQTSFAKCTFNKDYTKKSDIVCKSTDGKFTINVQNHSIKRVVDGANITIKNADGKTNTIENHYNIKYHGDKWIMIPNGSLTK